MRLFLALVFATLLTVSPALAQPLPDSLRAAGVTQAQWRQAQGVIRSQARSLDLRERAVRSLAVDIFEGHPDLSFEACLELIREGAARLPELVAAARALNPDGDPLLADLKRRAIAAAGAGRLREALSLQDQYAAALQRALERAVERPMLDLAASYAAAGDTAFVLGDYLAAADRYARAAEAAPQSAIEVRWRHRASQASSLWRRGDLFFDPATSQEAVRLYEQVVLPLAPREVRPADWAATQQDLGIALQILGERGAPDGLGRSVAAYEAALEVRTREADPEGWAQTQMNLANALQIQGQRGIPQAVERAIAAYESALTITTAEGDPDSWARIQMNLGNALSVLGSRGADRELERAVAAYEAALTVWTRDANPAGWAMIQTNMGAALRSLGQRGAPGALERAAAAYAAALSVTPRDANPVAWARAQVNLGVVLIVQGQLGAAGALERAVACFEAALTAITSETYPAAWSLTQSNLGAAYFALYERGANDALDHAEAAYGRALTVATRESDPHTWANIHYNLAETYKARGRFAEARAAAEGALAVYEQVGDDHYANALRTFIQDLPAD
ncbi:MAG: hypothetical protein AB7T59_09755 [Hyphomonadaceae bacterium]